MAALDSVLSFPSISPQEQAQNSADLVQISASLNQAQLRWAQLYDTYEEAWTGAYENFEGVLLGIGKQKLARAELQRAVLSIAVDVALVFATWGAGAAAVRALPITTARLSLLRNHIVRTSATFDKAIEAKFNAGVANLKTAGQKFIGAKVGEIEKQAKNWVLDQIVPLKSAQELVGLKPLPDGATPKSIALAFKEAGRIENDRLAGWVTELSALNASRDWKAMFIPLAKETFLGTAWVKTVPPVAKTLSHRSDLSSAVELILWLWWNANLDHDYWKKVSNLRISKYPKAGTLNQKRESFLMNLHAFDDLVDFSPVAKRMSDIDPYYLKHVSMMVDSIPKTVGYVERGPVEFPVMDFASLYEDNHRYDVVARRFRNLGPSVLGKHALDALHSRRKEVSVFQQIVLDAYALAKKYSTVK